MSKMIWALWCILLLGALSGCIAKVQWEQRQGGNPVKEHWVPVCPLCKEVVDFRASQCSNPNCRTLLRWKDKTVYAEEIYGEIQSAKAPAPPLEDVEPISTPKQDNSRVSEKEKTDEVKPWEEEVYGSDDAQDKAIVSSKSDGDASDDFVEDDDGDASDDFVEDDDGDASDDFVEDDDGDAANDNVDNDK